MTMAAPVIAKHTYVDFIDEVNKNYEKAERMKEEYGEHSHQYKDALFYAGVMRKSSMIRVNSKHGK